ncbi:MAG: phosphoribosyltransferase [Candidatus Hydrogenedentes bacterium]|nr:phosphoribosyltransferase [Candidatus Hydrogenedentota bacterium]
MMEVQFSSENIHYSTASREVSPGDYPKSLGRIVNNTTVSFLRKHIDYTMAKGSDADRSVPLEQRGEAAERTVHDRVKPKAVKALRELLDPNKPICFVPVAGIESAALNFLPTAYADMLADQLGGEVWIDICKNKGSANTDKALNKRLTNQQQFEGPVPPADTQIIIVDDVTTAGDTFTTLIDYLMKNDRIPVAATTLALSRYTANLKTPEEEIKKLLGKAEVSSVEFEYELGYPTKHITGQEARAYILSGKPGRNGLKAFFPKVLLPGKAEPISPEENQNAADSKPFSQKYYQLREQLHQGYAGILKAKAKRKAN